MHRTLPRMSGLLALGAIGLSIGLAACNQPGATPTVTPDAMMHESPSAGAMMNESPSTGAMMNESPSTH